METCATGSWLTLAWADIARSSRVSFTLRLRLVTAGAGGNWSYNALTCYIS